MANRYLVATGSWTDTAAWSSSSGGAPGASYPTSADDVFLDANSGAVTLTVIDNSACQSLTCTGFTGTLSCPSNVDLNIGSASGGSMLLVAGMTLTLSGNNSFTFVSTTTGNTVTFGGKTMGKVIFNGVGGAWTLQDALTTGSTSFIQVNNGTVDTNDVAISSGSFIIGASGGSGYGTRVVSLGSSTLTLSGNGTAWDATYTTGLTFNCETSSIVCSGVSAFFEGGGLTYNNVSMTSTSSNKTNKIIGSNTFANLTVTMGAVKTAEVFICGNQTVTGTLTLTGNSAVNRLWCRSGTRTGVNAVSFAPGTTRTITAAAVSLSQVDFTDITAAGAASPFTGTNLGDGLGNTNITTAAPVTRYWIGNAGTWSSTAEWSATSGGAGSAGVPICHDTVIFDANSFSANGHTVTVDMPRIGSVDFSATDQTFTLAVSQDTYFFNKVVLDTNITSTGSSDWYFVARSSVSFDNAGVSHPASRDLQIYAPGGTYTLTGNLTLSSTNAGIWLFFGTFDANGNNVTATFFTSTHSNTRALSMGAGTWTFTSASINAWNTTTNTNMTVTESTSSIVISGSGGGFQSGGDTFYDISFTGTGAHTVTGVNTFRNFTAATTATTTVDRVTLQNNQTITGTLTLTGASTTDRMLCWASLPGGTITLTAAAVSLTNVDFQDITGAGVAAPFTGTSLADWGGNSQITFTAAVTRYWVGNGGNWTDFANHWSASSGGAANASFPLGQDTVIFDAASFSSGSQTVSLDTTSRFACASLNFTGIDNSPTFDFSASHLHLLGNLTLAAGLTMASSGDFDLFIDARSNATITSNGISFAPDVTIQSVGATITLADNAVFQNYFELEYGRFDANDKNLSAQSVYGTSNDVGYPMVVDMGTGIWTLTGDDNNDYVWYLGDYGGLTVNAETATILINANTAVQKTFFGQGESGNASGPTFYKIEFDDTGGGGIEFFDSMTITWLKATVAPATITLDYYSNNSSTFTFNSIDMKGTTGNLIVFQSGFATAEARIVKTGTGQIVCDFLDVNDINGSVAGRFLLGKNSTDGGGNTNIEFVNPAKQVIAS